MPDGVRSSRTARGERWIARWRLGMAGLPRRASLPKVPEPDLSPLVSRSQVVQAYQRSDLLEYGDDG